MLPACRVLTEEPNVATWQDSGVPGLTLMVVHAHPDDESISTGGTLARYSAEGVRTVLVTCTDGALGFGPGMAPPGEDGHDEDAVARVRVDELLLAAERLGVSQVEMLGYRDSGMAGWSQNERATAFCNQPVDSVAARLVGLFERYRPEVVVTYYRSTGYNHPDHLHTHDVTLRAVEQSQIPEKLYLIARSRAGQRRVRDVMAARGIETAARPRPADARPPGDAAGPRATGGGVDDELFTTFVDVVPYLGARRAALEAHASQLRESYFLRPRPTTCGPTSTVGKRSSARETPRGRRFPSRTCSPACAEPSRRPQRVPSGSVLDRDAPPGRRRLDDGVEHELELASPWCALSRR